MTPQLADAIEKGAQRWSLPEWLVRGIAETESGGDPWAIRHEPDFLVRYIPQTVQTYGMSMTTERIARATSWGLMQIMGQTAREMGCTARSLGQLLDPDTCLYFACKYLAILKTRHFQTHRWQGVIAAYNAGSPRRTPAGEYINQHYVDKVLSHCTSPCEVLPEPGGEQQAPPASMS